MRVRSIPLAAALLAVGLTVQGADEPSPAPGTKVVLFVCEHGAARSVLAAALFNGKARERGLPYRAVARGSVAQEQPSAATVKGLAEEGLEARPAKPQQLTAGDVESASKVVTLGCDISAVAPKARVERWDDVPAPSDDYAAARRVVLRHLDALLADLAAAPR